MSLTRVLHRERVAGLSQWCYDCHEPADPRPAAGEPPVTRPGESCLLCHSGESYNGAEPFNVHEEHAGRLARTGPRPGRRLSTISSEKRSLRPTPVRGRAARAPTADALAGREGTRDGQIHLGGPCLDLPVGTLERAHANAVRTIICATLAKPPTVLITGAAGNLGGLLARRLISADCALRLMVHRTPLPADVERAANVTPVRADLSEPETLPPAVTGADVVDLAMPARSISSRPRTSKSDDAGSPPRSRSRSGHPPWP